MIDLLLLHVLSVYCSLHGVERNKYWHFLAGTAYNTKCMDICMH